MHPRALILALALTLLATPGVAQQPADMPKDAPQDLEAQAPAEQARDPEALSVEEVLDKDAPLRSMSSSARDEILAKHGLKKGLPRGADAWQAVFIRGSAAPGQLVVHDPKHGLTLYQGRKASAHERSIQLADDATCDQLSLSSPILPVRIIQDGTTQLLVWHVVEAPDKTQQLHITLLKPIGRFFGKTLDRVVAIRPDKKTPWSLVGRLDILRGQKHHALRWFPLAPDGSPSDKSPQLLIWNRWEGSFRQPKPPAARPKRPPAAS
jgi:hypothetical protein